MKKNFCKVRRGHCLSLVWIVSFLLWGNVTMAALPIQEAKLSIQQRSVALSRVFYEIEKQTGYSFLVRNNDINMNEKVSIDVKNKAIIYYFTQQNKSATAVIVVVVTNILI